MDHHRSKKRAFSSEVLEAEVGGEGTPEGLKQVGGSGGTRKQGMEAEETVNHGSTRGEFNHQGLPTFASMVRDGGLSNSNRNQGKKEQVAAMAKRWADQHRDGMEEGGSEEEHELCPSIHISRESILELSQPWWGSLIVKILGRKVSYQLLQSRLRALWRPSGEFKLTSMGADFYLVQLASWEDRDHVINDGPWAVFGHHLAVREWSPNFVPSEATINRAVVWVRVQGLPLEFFNPTCLTKIGNKLGKMVRLDSDTAAVGRCRYARFCIEVDLHRSLIGHFKLNERLYRVEYEGLQLVCFSCGRVGHRSDGCLNRIPSSEQEGEKGREGGVADTQGEKDDGIEGSARSATHNPNGEGVTAAISRAVVEEAHHGPWMTAPSRRRPRGRGFANGGGETGISRAISGGGGSGWGGGERRGTEPRVGNSQMIPTTGVFTRTPPPLAGNGPGSGGDFERARGKLPAFSSDFSPVGLGQNKRPTKVSSVRKIKSQARLGPGTGPFVPSEGWPEGRPFPGFQAAERRSAVVAGGPSQASAGRLGKMDEGRGGPSSSNISSTHTGNVPVITGGGEKLQSSEVRKEAAAEGGKGPASGRSRSTHTTNVSPAKGRKGGADTERSEDVTTTMAWEAADSVAALDHRTANSVDCGEEWLDLRSRSGEATSKLGEGSRVEPDPREAVDMVFEQGGVTGATDTIMTDRRRAEASGVDNTRMAALVHDEVSPSQTLSHSL